MRRYRNSASASKLSSATDVKDVRTTGKLTNSAVCLAVEEGAMDFRLERFLVEQKQFPAATAKILEINPKNSIIQSLVRKLTSKDFEHDIEDVAWLLTPDQCYSSKARKSLISPPSPAACRDLRGKEFSRLNDSVFPLPRLSPKPWRTRMRERVARRIVSAGVTGEGTS